MAEYTFLLGIAAILAAGAMSPGPSFMVVMQNALGKSRQHGLATAVGTGLGVAIFAVLASFGVTALLENSPKLFAFFKIAGGLYLLYIAYKIWGGAKQALDTQIAKDKESSGGLFQAFSTGLGTQLSNPKTVLVIAGIFAAFIPSEPPVYTVLFVTLIAFVIDFSWYAVVALTFSSAKARQVYATIKPYFDRLAAIFLGLIGIQLIFFLEAI